MITIDSEGKEFEVIRGASIAVSWSVRQGLQYVSRAKGDITPDALAENVLAEWLREHHPDVVNHMSTQRQKDNDFKTELKKKLNQSP